MCFSFGARMNGKRVILGGLDKNFGRMAHVHNMLLTGCGTSGHAGLFAAKLMRDLDCFDTVTVMDSAEVCYVIRYTISIAVVQQYA